MPKNLVLEDFISKVEERTEDNEYWGDIDSFDLEKPFALPLIEKPDDENWRFSVDFDKWNTDYWFSESTALFFGQLKFPKNDDITIEVFPSMGETEQNNSGLMGFGKIYTKVKPFKVKLARGGTSESDIATFVFGGVSPLWQRMKNEVPYFYSDNLNSFGLEWDQFISLKLPSGFNTPKIIWGSEAISYAMGYVALVHGLKQMVSNIPEFNKYLKTKKI